MRLISSSEGGLTLVLTFLGLSSTAVADKKWVWNDNRRSIDDDSSSSNQQSVSAVGQIKLKLDDQAGSTYNNNNKYTQRPQSDASSDESFDVNDNDYGSNPNKDYYRPQNFQNNNNRPFYQGGGGGRFPQQGGQYPQQQNGGGYPFEGDRYQPGAGGGGGGGYGGYDEDRFQGQNGGQNGGRPGGFQGAGYEGNGFYPGRPDKFSSNNAPFRPSRPFNPAFEGPTPYPGPWSGGQAGQGKCSCVKHFNCGAPGVLGGQCAPGKVLCCYDRQGGFGGPVGPIGPIRRPPYHSAANGILVGPGGPVDPIPGQNQYSHAANNNQSLQTHQRIVAAPSTTNKGTQRPNTFKIVMIRPVTNGRNVGQTNRPQNNFGINGGKLVYRVVNSQPNYQKPGASTYRVFEAGAVQRPTRAFDAGGGNAFRIFLNFMRGINPIRGSHIHSAANGVLVGPGGPTGIAGPIFNRNPHIANGILAGPYKYGYAGGNFIPGMFNRPYGGPYGAGPAGPYGNAYENYGRKAT